MGIRRVYEWSFEVVAKPLSTGAEVAGIGRPFVSSRITDGVTGGLREDMEFSAG